MPDLKQAIYFSKQAWLEVTKETVANCWRIGLACDKTWAPENNNWVNSAVNWANKPAPTFWISDQMLPKPSWFKKKSAKSLLPESI